ncbi:MAG: DUF2461 domain-containing protein [Mycobacteriales bacterium]
MSFTGFPVAALDFYDDLEADNSKSYWEAHRTTYEKSVKAPMTELASALEPEFGAAKIFRPYRDVRFAKDKTPYKTHQGAFVSMGPATGWYVEISAAGVRVAAGFYASGADRLAEIREAIDSPAGAELEAILARLTTIWDLGGEKLKTTPRGYDADHPRVELLRHKALTVSKSYGFAPVVHTAKLLARVRSDWRAGRPLVEWFADHARGA